MRLITIYHNFWWTVTTVVIGAHYESIGTGRTHCQQVTGLQSQWPVFANEISGFTDWPYQVPDFFLHFLMGFDRNNRLPCTVQSRPDQIIHGRINNSEIPVRRALQILNPGYQNAGISRYGPTWLQYDFKFPVSHALQQCFDILSRLGRLLLIVGNAQTTTHINMMNPDTLPLKLIDKSQHSVQCVQKRLYCGELGANMAINTQDFQIWQCRRPCINGRSFRDINSKLVFFKPGGDIRVCTSVNIRIYPKGNRGLDIQFAGNLIQTVKFGVGFHVETANTNLQGAFHFPGLLTNP